MMSSYLKTSVFARPHEYHTSPFSKISTLESVFENLRLRCPKTPGTCEPVAVFGEKILRFRKYPATCGRGLIPRPHVCVFVLKTQLFLRFKKKIARTERFRIVSFRPHDSRRRSRIAHVQHIHIESPRKTHRHSK